MSAVLGSKQAVLSLPDPTFSLQGVSRPQLTLREPSVISGLYLGKKGEGKTKQTQQLLSKAEHQIKAK